MYDQWSCWDYRSLLSIWIDLKFYLKMTSISLFRWSYIQKALKLKIWSNTLVYKYTLDTWKIGHENFLGPFSEWKLVVHSIP